MRYCSNRLGNDNGNKNYKPKKSKIMNYKILLTENSSNGRKLETITTIEQLTDNIEKQQFKGGFKRFEIDLIEETIEPMRYLDCRKQQTFINEITN